METIRRTTHFARNNEAEFIEQLREASSLRQNESAKATKRQIAKSEKRIAELDHLFRKTYEDYATERLAESRFELLSAGYEKEQAELKTQTDKLKAELAQFETDTFRADKFMELTKRYTDFTELSPAMLNEFVDKVVVHAMDKSSGERVQQVDIYLSYIGQFEVPEAECDEQNAADEKKAQERRYFRERAERIRKEKRQATQQDEPNQKPSDQETA